MKEKIGILYICTGRYDMFWKKFYESCESFYLPQHEKQYFVFTDADHIHAEEEERVHKIFQAKLEFPKDTLLRFDMFLGIRERLKDFDYVYYFNANLQFLKEINGDEVFPSAEENGLIGYLHFNYYDKKPEEFIYERNPVSTAYIPVGVGTHYYQGCVIGGQTQSFLAMAAVLSERIKKDLEKDFIAVWWDESHLNYFLLDKKVKILHPGYCFPEDGFDDLPFEKKAMSRNKTKRGGVQYLRGQDNSFKTRLKFLVKKIIFFKRF